MATVQSTCSVVPVVRVVPIVPVIAVIPAPVVRLMSTLIPVGLSPTIPPLIPCRKEAPVVECSGMLGRVGHCRSMSKAVV